MTSTKISRLLGYLTAVSLPIAGLCLMISCYCIYRTGEFTPQAVAEGFAPIAVPVLLSLALCIAGWILNLFLPRQAEKVKPARQQERILSRLRAKADLTACDQPLLQKIDAELRRRSRLSALRLGVCLFCATFFLTYAVNGANFHTSQINASMIRAMTVLVPCLILSFGVCIFVSYRTGASIEREITLLKQAPVLSAPGKPEVAPPEAPLYRKQAVILGLALALLLYGFFTGGTADVLTKAVNICTECVGLG